MNNKAWFKIANLCVFIVLMGFGIYQANWLPLIDEKRSIDRKSYANWQKLSGEGKIIDKQSGPWLCARDTESGLLWENKSPFEGLHHTKWTYTWATQRSRQEGSCNGLQHCYVEELVRIANQQQWCGMRNWRVPTIDELKTLLDESYPTPGPLICPCFLPHTQRSSYWALSANRQYRYVGLNFQNGEVKPFPEYAALYLRLVSSD